MSRPPRCLVEDTDVASPRVPDDQRRHIERSLRIRDGEHVELVDGRGGWALAAWRRSEAPEVVERAARTAPDRERVTLAVGCPRLPRLEWLVEKAAELGVARIVPVETEHAERTPGPGRLARLERKAASALLQSRGLHALTVAPATSLDGVLAEAWDTVWVGAVPDEVSDALPPAAGSLLIVVGPEGGLTEAERQALDRAGAHGVTIGPQVLRVETAAIALIALSHHARC